MIRLMIDNEQYKVNWLTFSDGAKTCKVENLPDEARVVWITVDPSTNVSDYLLEILLVRDAVWMQTEVKKWGLNLPYLPFGRADRRFEVGNPIPIKVFLNIVGEYFDEIHTVDIHNRKLLQLDRTDLFETTQLKAIWCTMSYLDYDYVVAPDKGAETKIEEIGLPFITANKVRCVSTGKILHTEVNTIEDLTGKRLLIVDDILDGGGTFIPLANKLKEMGAGAVDLYVTHLIAAKGLDIFKGVIDNIFCYHTVGKYVNQTDVLNFNLGK